MKRIVDFYREYERIVMSQGENKKEKLCMLMDEINIYYKLYDDKWEKDRKAVTLYRKIANSR